MTEIWAPSEESGESTTPDHHGSFSRIAVSGRGIQRQRKAIAYVDVSSVLLCLRSLLEVVYRLVRGDEDP